MNIYRASLEFSISIFFALYSVACLAYSPAIMPVADRTDYITYSFQKGSEKNLYIWDAVSGGEGSIDSTPPPELDYNYYGRMNWVCTSNSDSSKGLCGTTSGWFSQGSNQIQLKFTEKTTGISKDIFLTGWNSKINYSGSATYGNFPIQSASNAHYYYPAQSMLSIKIPSYELNKLPIGGIWQASLVLNQHSWDPATTVATWKANITINMIDSKNIQIYLPNYNTASPTVDLSLKRVPSPDSNPIIAGNVNIDACLYDGYNAQSRNYDITMSDPNSKDSNFYITNKTINPNPKFSNIIPYQVWVSTPAAPSVAAQQVLSNILFSFTGVNQSTPKLVTLPNVPAPVYCTPWLINLKTANITQNNHAPGHYQGSIHLKFTPSSSSL